MYLLYSLLFTIGIIMLLPRFVADAVRHGKYAAGLGERLGGLPQIETAGRPVIWLHCVSVGETQAARPLVGALRERYPHYALVVSTTTQTGQRVAREVFRDEAAQVFYFPFDWAWTVRRALRRVNPALVLIMETELWPRFLRECRRRKVPVALVNGRISEKSFRNYRRARRFIARTLADLSLAVMQAEADAGRIRALGLASDRLAVSGNVKFDIEAAASDARAVTEELCARFQLNEEQPLIVAASTHAPEERITLAAFQELRETIKDKRPRLLVAPRHPERFAEVAALLEESGLIWARRSAAANGDDAACEAILLDSIGELRAIYPLAAIVFVGGSIAPVGGHNVLEPAAVARPIVTGAHTANFAGITRMFRECDALIQLEPLMEQAAPAALARVFLELLTDDERRRALGQRARAALEESRGATARTVELIKPLLRQRSEVKSQLLEVRGQRPEVSS